MLHIQFCILSYLGPQSTEKDFQATKSLIFHIRDLDFSLAKQDYSEITDERQLWFIPSRRMTDEEMEYLVQTVSSPLLSLEFEEQHIVKLF